MKSLRAVLVTVLFGMSMFYLSSAKADGQWNLWFTWNIPMHTPPPPQHYFPECGPYWHCNNSGVIGSMSDNTYYYLSYGCNRWANHCRMAPPIHLHHAGSDRPHTHNWGQQHGPVLLQYDPHHRHIVLGQHSHRHHVHDNRCYTDHWHGHHSHSHHWNGHHSHNDR